MVSYVQTPLFPIQEAASSASSLPANSTPTNPSMVADNHDEYKLHTIFYNYRQSEKEYLVELKTLYSIVKNFDPIYNNYYDGSMDDITDEMVEKRKEKNDIFKNLVRELILKHSEINEIFRLPKNDAVLMGLVNWSNCITELYTKYVDFYKLDVSQCKTEIKIRRRPLIRIRYLNDFFKSLKEIIILMGEKPYTATVISSFEILIFRLTKCLEYSKERDDLEKQKCGNHLYTINAKDIIELKPVLADIRQSQLDQEYFCDLHYISQSTTLNFKNISVFTLKDTKIDQLAILQRDTFGNYLLFAPLRKNEFTLQMTNEISGKSLVFSHSVLKDKLKICFTFNQNTNPELSSVLLKYFPRYVPSAIYNIPKFGLGIRMGKDGDEITKVTQQEAILSNEIGTGNQKETNVSVTNLQEKKEKDSRILENNYNTEKNNNDDNNNNNNNNNDNTPLYLKFASNDKLIGSQCNSKCEYNFIDSSQVKEESKGFKQVLNQVANGDVSDDEGMTDEVESVISTEYTQGLNIKPIQRFSTPSELLQNSSCTRKEITPKTSQNTSVRKTLKTINVEKYQNSLHAKVKPKRKSIFGAFSNLLSRKQNKLQLNSNFDFSNSKNPIASVSSVSLQSLSSVLSFGDDFEMQNFLRQAKSKVLPPAAVAIWNTSNWTKSKNLNLILHNKAETQFYIGFYENKKLLLLLELNDSTDCMFNTIDIHLKTQNMKGNEITVLIRPLDRNDMKLIGNALVNPELFETIVNNSSSVSSNLSDATQTSIESVATSAEVEMKNVDVVEYNIKGKERLDEYKSWTGVGDLKLIMSSKKLEDLNRCVVDVKRIGKNITFDLTGFEFGNIEVMVDLNQIKILENNSVIINGGNKGVYLLSLDSHEDVNNMKSCFF